MKRFFFMLFFVFGMATFVSASSTLSLEGSIINPQDPNIQYVGRFLIDNPSGPMFNWPGSEIRACFQGTSLKMIAKPKSGYFMCRIDDAAPFKVSFNAEKDSVVNLATALPNGAHSVELMYIIEGLSRHAEFRGFVLDKGCQLVAPRPLQKRKIEFIGNSITCAYGIESTNKTDPFEDETENHYMSYASIVSRNLDAQHFSISRSGIGVYRNYDGPKAGSQWAMPSQYENTIFEDSTWKWDFSRWTPDLVFINLGTNDFSTNNYDAVLYKKAYHKFIQQVRSHYPQAKIVLASGPMLNDKESNIQKQILDKLQKECQKSGDKRIYRFDFSHQTGELGYGASWHPSKRQQERMAAELTPFLQTIMHW